LEMAKTWMQAALEVERSVGAHELSLERFK